MISTSNQLDMMWNIKMSTCQIIDSTNSLSILLFLKILGNRLNVSLGKEHAMHPETKKGFISITA